MKRLFVLVSSTVLLGSISFAQSTTGNTSVQVQVNPEASITINTATTTLSSSSTPFSNYTGSTSFTYKVRTTEVDGSGSLKLQATEFGAGGPTVSLLSYSCSTSGVGTACSATTPSTSSQTDVLTFGTNAHSNDSGDSGSVTWTLPNKPTYKTGAYSSTVTFTIAAV